MKDILEDIRNNKVELLSTSEESIKTSIVLRILQNLGWNIFDSKELKAEYSNGKGRVDYALCENNHLKILIEAKKASVSLEYHEEQLLNYSFTVGVGLAILTNGFTWWFYLPLEKGHWKERKFLNIDILNQSDEKIIERFEKFLLKENILNGKAEKHAKETYSNSKIKETVKNELPVIWNDLLSKPDDLLVDLLKEEVEKKLGYTFDTNLIKDFLKNVPIYNNKNNENQQEKPILKTPKEYHINNTNTPIQYKLYDSDVSAIGFFSNGNRFTVMKGSKIRMQTSADFDNNQRTNRNKRNDLIKSGKIDKNFTFTCNVEFNSPSQAATIILGRSANGHKEFNIK